MAFRRAVFFAGARANGGLRAGTPLVAGSRGMAVAAPAVEERLADLLAAMDKAKAGAVPSGSFSELGLTPIDVAEVLVAVEDEFALDIPKKDSDAFKDFSGVVSFVAGAANAK